LLRNGEFGWQWRVMSGQQMRFAATEIERKQVFYVAALFLGA
jgi:hypothetical protein